MSQKPSLVRGRSASSIRTSEERSNSNPRRRSRPGSRHSIAISAASHHTKAHFARSASFGRGFNSRLNLTKMGNNSEQITQIEPTEVTNTGNSDKNLGITQTNLKPQTTIEPTNQNYKPLLYTRSSDSIYDSRHLPPAPFRHRPPNGTTNTQNCGADSDGSDGSDGTEGTSVSAPQSDSEAESDSTTVRVTSTEAPMAPTAPTAPTALDRGRPDLPKIPERPERSETETPSAEVPSGVSGESGVNNTNHKHNITQTQNPRDPPPRGTPLSSVESADNHYMTDVLLSQSTGMMRPLPQMAAVAQQKVPEEESSPSGGSASHSSSHLNLVVARERAIQRKLREKSDISNATNATNVTNSTSIPPQNGTSADPSGQYSAHIGPAGKTVSTTTRTQQRLWLQRQSSFLDSASAAALARRDSASALASASASASELRAALPALPPNPNDAFTTSIQYRREYERLSREYMSVRRYVNPVAESLARVKQRAELGVSVAENSARKSRIIQSERSSRAAGMRSAPGVNPGTGSEEINEMITKRALWNLWADGWDDQLKTPAASSTALEQLSQLSLWSGQNGPNGPNGPNGTNVISGSGSIGTSGPGLNHNSPQTNNSTSSGPIGGSSGGVSGRSFNNSVIPGALGKTNAANLHSMFQTQKQGRRGLQTEPSGLPQTHAQRLSRPAEATVEDDGGMDGAVNYDSIRRQAEQVSRQLMVGPNDR